MTADEQGARAAYESEVYSVPRFKVQCSCGWESALYKVMRDADRAADEHDDEHEQAVEVTS